MTTAPKGPSPNLPATNRFALDRTRRRQRSVRSPQVAIPPTPAPTWQLGVHRQHHGRRAPPIRHHPAPPFGAQILPPLTRVLLANFVPPYPKYLRCRVSIPEDERHY